MLLAALALTFATAPCRGVDTDLPRPLAGWTRSGRGLDTRHALVLATRGGRAQTLVTIRKPGTFGIAVDRAGWIDVYRGRGKALAMASESRGPRCSSIAKIVRYRLQPGRYRVEVRNVKAERVRVMLTRGETR